MQRQKQKRKQMKNNDEALLQILEEKKNRKEKGTECLQFALCIRKMHFHNLNSGEGCRNSSNMHSWMSSSSYWPQNHEINFCRCIQIAIQRLIPPHHILFSKSEGNFFPSLPPLTFLNSSVSTA